MAGFSTVALIGLGLAAATAAATRRGGGTASQTNIGGARTPTENAEYTGEHAVTREQYAANQEAARTAALSSPSTSSSNSSNMVTAYTAADRARKRAAAGGSILTGAQRGSPGPRGSFAPKTLLGGG